MPKIGKSQKILILIGVASLLVAVLIPLITALLGDTGIPTTGKQVKCETVILNPVLTDNYRIEQVECITKSSLFCGIPLSIAGLSFFRQEDDVTLKISAEGQLSKSVTTRIDEGIISGVRKDVSISYCVPPDVNEITLTVLNSDNEETFSMGVNI